MSSEREAASPPTHAGAQFTTTHWSVVLAAGHDSSPDAREALERLCRTYWYPLYAYVRRHGHNEQDAQDLVQGFFTRLFQLRSLRQVSAAKGKFRSFLLASLNHFLADARDFAQAEKRGGGQELLSLDTQDAEVRYRLEPVDDCSPDRLFERRWALTLLDQAFASLEKEFATAGKTRTFESLRPFLLPGLDTGTLAQTARALGQSEEAVKKAVQRMRKRCHELLRQEIAQTVSTPAEVDEELRYLCEVMARG